MSRPFRVGIPTSFINSDGKPLWGDMGLGLLESDPRTEYGFFDASGPAVPAARAREFDGIIAGGEPYTADTLAGAESLVAIGRFGVGYDRVDTTACTEAGVALFITPDGVRRPVATSALALMLSLSLKLPQKALYSRLGQPRRVSEQVGTGLIGRTLGSIGVGNIGRDLFRLAAPLEMRMIASDPMVAQADLDPFGVTLVPLRKLLEEADFVCVNCPLTSETQGLINDERLGWMKPSAVLINTARGGIVDTGALVRALESGRLAGAGLDVTDPEPLPLHHPLLEMDNVIVTSHRLAFTDQLVLGIGTADVEGMRMLAHGRIPPAVVNRDVLDRPAFKAKLERWRD